MKRLATMLFAALLALGPPTAFAHTIEMRVNGLVCAFCAQGIEKQLKRLDATTEVFVNLEHRIVAIALKQDQDIDDATLRKAITDAGYTVTSIERSERPLAEVRAATIGQDDD